MRTRNLYPSELQDRLIVRFPDGMRDKLAALAKANGHSMNAEVIRRLQASFEADQNSQVPDFTKEGTDQLIRETHKMVSALYDAVKVPQPMPPFSFHKKAKPKLDGTE